MCPIFGEFRDPCLSYPDTYTYVCKSEMNIFRQFYSSAPWIIRHVLIASNSNICRQDLDSGGKYGVIYGTLKFSRAILYVSCAYLIINFNMIAGWDAKIKNASQN